MNCIQRVSTDRFTQPSANRCNHNTLARSHAGPRNPFRETLPFLQSALEIVPLNVGRIGDDDTFAVEVGQLAE